MFRNLCKQFQQCICVVTDVNTTQFTCAELTWIQKQVRYTKVKLFFSEYL